MGTLSTRRRYLSNDYGIMLRHHDYAGIKDYYSPISQADFTRYNPTQFTESYRTLRATGQKLPSEMSGVEDSEFTDVTRNGFTEPDPAFDTGHAFYTSKAQLTTSHPKWDFTWVDPSYPPYTYRQKGPLFFNVTTGIGDGMTYGGGGPAWASEQCTRLSTNDANRLGTSFIARTLPTKGPVSLSAILGEAVQDLPKLPAMAFLKGNQGSIPREAGGEFLNYTFGIAPTASDIQDLLKSVGQAAKLIKQYHRDSGRRVRRRLSNPPVTETTVNLAVPQPSNGQPLLYGWGGGKLASSSTSQIQLSQTTTTRSWFSGAYSYHLPDADGIIGRMENVEREVNFLLGIGVTLDTLWQLTPWSWLFDWFANVGDILTNASYLGSDGLVLRYGYLMNHVKVVQKYHLPTGVTFAGGAKTGPIYNTLTFESKERVRATPYGFGTSLSALSAKQWAILGALGLTRAPQTLV